MSIRFLALIALGGLILGGCTIPGSITPSHGDRADVGTSSRGFVSTGSGRVRPDDMDHIPLEQDREVPDPTEELWPELPQEALASVKKWMTEEELVALLGPPEFKEVAVEGIDRDDREWNPCRYTWKYQDSRHTIMEMTRDFIVLLGKADHRRPLPQRPEVKGPTWVVLSWSLF